MKHLISAAATAILLSLAGCAKHKEPAVNVAGGDTTTNVEALGNDGVFASENVILPGENLTDASLANL